MGLSQWDADNLTDRAEICRQLEAYKTHEGKLMVPKVIEEIYIQQVITNRRLIQGSRQMARCKVLKGEMTFEDVHGNNGKDGKKPEEPKLDEIKFTGKTRMKTLILIIIVIAAIAIPGGVAALVLKIGGLP